MYTYIIHTYIHTYRLTVSNHRENLRQKPPSRSRSPIVQRKTKAVVDTHSHLGSGLVCEDDTQVYTVSPCIYEMHCIHPSIPLFFHDSYIFNSLSLS